jgi:hypothetical protein
MMDNKFRAHIQTKPYFPDCCECTALQIVNIFNDWLETYQKQIDQENKNDSHEVALMVISEIIKNFKGIYE